MTAEWDAAHEIYAGRHDLKEARFRGRGPAGGSPYLLETSLLGVFAVGDVRCGNVKRVASAVGEGSSAVSFVLARWLSSQDLKNPALIVWSML